MMVATSFVEVNKNSEWFLKLVGGIACHKGGCKAVRILDDLYGEILKLGGDDQLSAVAGQQPPAVAEDDNDEDAADPMDLLDGDCDPSYYAAKKENKRPRRKVVRHEIKTVVMPLRPPCADASCTDTKTVMVYYAGSNGRKKYLRCEDLNWLIAYAADELHFQGVVCDGRGDIYNKSANCPAVADLNVEWDSQTKTWRAEFVDGEFRGLLPI